MFWLTAAFTLVMAVIPVPPSFATDKIEHMLAFAVLAGLAVFGFSRVAIWKLFLTFAVFGGTIELVQALPIVGRDGDWSDWLADLVTAGTMLAIGGGLRRLRQPAAASA